MGFRIGVASGDRPQEFPAMNISFPDRGERFRDSFGYIRKMTDDFPTHDSMQGAVAGMDMLPKPTANRIPLLVTGGSQQSPDWSANHADGWMTYPRGVHQQAQVIADWCSRIPTDQGIDKSIMQSLYIDLVADPDAAPQPIHLGFRSGIIALRTYLKRRRKCLAQRRWRHTSPICPASRKPKPSRRPSLKNTPHLIRSSPTRLNHTGPERLARRYKY